MAQARPAQETWHHLAPCGLQNLACLTVVRACSPRSHGVFRRAPEALALPDASHRDYKRRASSSPPPSAAVRSLNSIHLTVFRPRLTSPGDTSLTSSPSSVAASLTTGCSSMAVQTSASSHSLSV